MKIFIETIRSSNSNNLLKFEFINSSLFDGYIKEENDEN